MSRHRLSERTTMRGQSGRAKKTPDAARRRRSAHTHLRLSSEDLRPVEKRRSNEVRREEVSRTGRKEKTRTDLHDPESPIRMEAKLRCRRKRCCERRRWRSAFKNERKGKGRVFIRTRERNEHGTPILTVNPTLSGCLEDFSRILGSTLWNPNQGWKESKA